jgi:UDP-N-acetylglucosamine 2-epimerase (non-hydrolysing)
MIMAKSKVLIVFGTRPEAIKLAPIIKRLKARSSKLEPVVCVTAQHREMLDQVLRLFKIAPDYDLDLMKKDQTLFDITAEGLKRIRGVLEKEKPDLILVQGDTTTTFVAGLAAYYLKIRLAHLEAGLRTADKYNPFPEEMNRKLTDCLADLYFAHTAKAKENMIREGISPKNIFVTGNTVVDALLMTLEEQKKKEILTGIEWHFIEKYGISFEERKTLLVTCHRRESFGKDLESICIGLKRIAKSRADVQLIYPLHLNPNVQKPVRRVLGGMENVHLIEPLDYSSFVWVMNRAYLILTDSGGIQEEAPSLGKPILVMRKTTERTEGIEAGTAKLIGTDSKNILDEAMKLICDKRLYEEMTKAANPYGDGKASERIYDILLDRMSNPVKPSRRRIETRGADET